jgi:hypothetical protein
MLQQKCTDIVFVEKCSNNQIMFMIKNAFIAVLTLDMLTEYGDQDKIWIRILLIAIKQMNFV